MEESLTPMLSIVIVGLIMAIILYKTPKKKFKDTNVVYKNGVLCEERKNYPVMQDDFRAKLIESEEELPCQQQQS